MGCDRREKFLYRVLDLGIREQLVGYIYKSKIYGKIARYEMTVQAVGLAHTAPHRHAVNGMADALLGDGDKKPRNLDFTITIHTPCQPQGIGQRAAHILIGP